MNKYTFEMIECLKRAGISEHDAWALRRCAMTLHRWAELECGDGNDYASWAIERDETTGKPFLVTHPHKGDSRKSPVADRETGALKRVASIVASYPRFKFYHQTDPRGASLYILRPGDVKRGEDVASLYNRGIAVFK